MSYIANVFEMFQVQMMFSKRSTQELTISSGGEWYTKRILRFKTTLLKLWCSSSNQRYHHIKYTRLYTTWQLSARIRSATEVRYNDLATFLLNESLFYTRCYEQYQYNVLIIRHVLITTSLGNYVYTLKLCITQRWDVDITRRCFDKSRH